MKLYNTLIRKTEDFEPLKKDVVTFYSCGPTVYDYTHIGHLRTFTNNDTLKRTLMYLGKNVKHVMNITDVGHLTSDADAGEDKLEKGAKKTGKTVWEVAEFYTNHFINSISELNITMPNTLAKATEHIKPMIKLIEILKEKDYAYETDEALYFDVPKFKNYGKLSGQPLEEKLKGVRDEVYADPQKRHPADFSLWFKRVKRFADHQMHWPSPWGEGFPGWHIECSAMSMEYLGATIDIHAGGVDHIPVHHENEIAQSEAATGKPFVKYWFHNQFVTVNGEKMSKSLGNFYTINDVKEKGIEPLALRYLYLQAHYRQLMNFTWDSLQAAQTGLENLKKTVRSLQNQTSRVTLSEEKLNKLDDYRNRFIEAMSNDLQTPQALAVMWEMLKSNIPSTDKLDMLYEMDQVFGLRLTEIEEHQIPEHIKKMADERMKLKVDKNFTASDQLRDKIEQEGYEIEDKGNTYNIRKK